MSVKNSSSSNDSLLHPNISSISSDVPLYIYCLTSQPSSFIFTAFSIAYILLLLPLCIFIIYHGVQQWRQNRSTSSAATMSHSDSFTYNMVAMELIRVFGCILSICGIYSDHLNMLIGGFFLFSLTWFGQIYFHVLTCVERYLAVIHPITYLSLKKERGIRIRNISIGCVWLLCIAEMSFSVMGDAIVIGNFCLLLLSVILVSFCSVSVLCVLIRPGPGEQVGGRQRVDQSKQTAFYTIMIILGVLVLKFSMDLVWSVFYVWNDGVMNHGKCMVMAFTLWLNLPNSLVLPLLFLKRAEKLVCWKKSIQ